MRLLKVDDLGGITLTKDIVEDVPSYAILSHTWGAEEEEVTFNDMENGSAESKAGYAKVRFCAEQTRRDALQYFWIDTCCINKANHVELSEAITSMFTWYRDAVKCYVYLSDVSIEPNDHENNEVNWKSAFQKSRWHGRGWTLQELIAPALVEFYSYQGQWLGDKTTLTSEIHEVTGIPLTALHGAPLSSFSIEERLQWAAKRSTKRKEDRAYCLLGIFEIFMPLIYGEGDHAFRRLKKKIEKRSKTDRSLVNSLFQSTHDHLPETHMVLCGIPAFNKKFFSRVDEIDYLNKKLNHNKDHQERVVLYGLPGMGKTTIALQFVELYRDRYSFVVWINASSPENAQESFREAAVAITKEGYSFKSAADLPPDEKFSVRSVVTWLESNGLAWLLVIDGLDDLDAVDARMYLPQCMHGAVLITSILSHTAKTFSATSIQIGPLTAHAAAHILLSWLPSNPNSTAEMEEAEAVSEKLDCVPLAVEQAGALIAKTGMSFTEFLEEYTHNYKSVMAEKPARSEWNYNKNLSVYTTFEMLLNHKLLRDEQTHHRIIILLSFLGPGETPIDVISQQEVISRPNTDSEDVGTASKSAKTAIFNDLCMWYQRIARPKNFLLKLSILHLEDFSLLTVARRPSGEIRGVSLHGAIHAWITSTLGEDERIAWTIFAASLFCAKLPRTTEDFIPSLGRYVYQANNMFSKVRKNIKLASATKIDKMLVQHYGIAMNKLAYHFSRSQNHVHTEEAVVRAIEYEMSLQRAEWPRDEMSLELLNLLGEVYWKSGRLESAEGVFQQLLESSMAMLGLEADFTLAMSIKLKQVRERITDGRELQDRATHAGTQPKRAGDSLSYSAATEGRPPHPADDYDKEDLSGGDAIIEDLYINLAIAKSLDDDRSFHLAIPAYLKLWPRALCYEVPLDEAAAALTGKEPRFEALLDLM